MGVDPGLITTGYGIIEFAKDQTNVVTWGTVQPPTKNMIHARLSILYDGLLDVIDRYSPSEFAIEEAFYKNNAKTAFLLGQARGVAMLAAATRKLSCSEYSPRKIKMSVVGNGNASKEQVKYMVGSILKMDKTPEILDVTDALATALCHLHQSNTIVK